MLSDDQILRRLRDEVDHPATVKELLQVLQIPREARATFKRQLRGLVASGALIEIRGQRYGLPDRMNLVVGRVSTNPRGFAFVEPEAPLEGMTADIFIAGNNLNQAVHGDRVVVRVEHRRGGDRAEGRIVRVLERGAGRVVGRYDLDESGMGFVVPFDRRLIMDVQVARGESKGASPGQMVTVDITRWPTPTRPALGSVVEVLGALDAPGVDTAVIIRKYALPDEHGADALAEAARIGPDVGERDLAGRTDFRDWPTVTIDGEHARDFDDAISIDRLPNGNFWLGVHVADVSYYVREGSALDREAYERGTSVYFPERAVHMFPTALATGLCSLNPHVDRLVQSCLMEVDRRSGAVVRYEMHDGVIHSAARMTYTQVNAILTDRDPAAMEQHHDRVPMFERMHELFGILNGRRRRRGSIDFDLKEPEFVLDDQGLVEAVIAAERNVAHRIIEEFMLLANETVAGHFEQQRVPGLFRIHEAPDPAKVELFEEFIGTLGYSLSGPADRLEPRDFQQLVQKIQGRPEEKPIAFLLLRTMQKARYDGTNVGHFGLAADAYAHFTSPIRRYPDLVVHRLLRESRPGLDDDRRTELDEDMPEIARHTSERERRAADAERELVQWKKVRFMTDKVGDVFDGYITGVSAFGLYIELVEHFVEGMVHVSTMADDYYRFVERAHVLRGETNEKVYRLGDRVSVQVIRVDLERRQIDLALTEILDAVRTTSPRRGSGRGGARKKAARPGAREGEGQDARRRRRPGPRERAFKRVSRRK
ncbi:MAG TPA: ribonuclease R [Vicinamibacterales bacterium]|nr:ribonuclease R [Vicinamibacterales bacterium]